MSSLIGVWVIVRSAQSITMTWPARAPAITIGSMMPLGTPTQSFSTFWASRAMAVGVILCPARDARALSTAISKAADDDTPAPTGRSVSIVSAEATTSLPWCAQTAAQPAMWWAHSGTSRIGSARLITVSPKPAAVTRRWSPVIRDAATVVPIANATGAT